MNEVAYELPYAQGLQFIWDARAANGDPVRSMYNPSSTSKQVRFNNLMG